MDRFNPRLDEYEIDFDDNRDYALARWGEILSAALETLSTADRAFVLVPRDHNVVQSDLIAKSKEPGIPSVVKRDLTQMSGPVPRSLENLGQDFIQALLPNTVTLDIMWGLLLLNVKLSLDSPIRMQRTREWLLKLRRVTERFHQCYRMSDNAQEQIFAIMDTLDHVMGVMTDSVRYLRRHSGDDPHAWGAVREKIIMHQRELDDVIDHLMKIQMFSASNLQDVTKNLTNRHKPDPDSDDLAKFPLAMLPFSKRTHFYGRTGEIENIHQALKWEGNRPLRNYSIYGRRGIGKTEIALEYCYRNPTCFDAIFWIRCETTLTLRQSFTDIALKLQLPGADKNGQHEENALKVKRWLKHTRKRWLMIFDNAEKPSEKVLAGYWPTGANGAILITSRTYYNFMEDANRKGETVKVFNDKESWELLLLLLGEKYQEAYKNNVMRQADIVAAKAWLDRLGGLPLSIGTAASLILNPKTPSGSTIAETYETFKDHVETLPERQRADRSPLVQNLDALFDMTFAHLGKPARSLLSILALLSPDEIPVELFLPRQQTALNGKLEFAKQTSPLFINPEKEVALVTLTPPPALATALYELKNAGLIRWDGRTIAVHRVVQEAMNYYSAEDLQDSFNSAFQIIYEAFPKQKYGNTLYEEWELCGSYITHAAHIAKKFTEYKFTAYRKVDLKPIQEMVHLLIHATWYLYEMGDYTLGVEIVDIAKAACADKNSAEFARLCSCQGANYFELNRAADCRSNWEYAIGLREEALAAAPEDTNAIADLGISLHNLGNMEHAAGNYDQALEYFGRAVDIRLKIGDAVALHLATTYLGIGRCYAQQGKFEDATQMYGQAEHLFVRALGAQKHFMAHCHYAYGNLALDQKNYDHARHAFENCLDIAAAEIPIHPITCSAYYSLGCTEFAMGHNDPAKQFLNKARSIAELRSPSRDDGTIARILWKLAQVLKDDPLGGGVPEANILLGRAHNARAALISSGEAGEADAIVTKDALGRTDMELEEESFDQLVPGYFR